MDGGGATVDDANGMNSALAESAVKTDPQESQWIKGVGKLILSGFVNAAVLRQG